MLGERFRRAIQRAPWKQRPITVSIGAATTNDNMESPTDLVQAGDGALYHAKQHGRNRVSTAADTTSME